MNPNAATDDDDDDGRIEDTDRKRLCCIQLLQLLESDDRGIDLYFLKVGIRYTHSLLVI